MALKTIFVAGARGIGMHMVSVLHFTSPQGHSTTCIKLFKEKSERIQTFSASHTGGINCFIGLKYNLFMAFK